uniref:Uncharacterized protein n=1 Tax=Salix viminalis TaxID=40686 RepID=A0A6N2KGK1_SALVM
MDLNPLTNFFIVDGLIKVIVLQKPIEEPHYSIESKGNRQVYLKESYTGAKNIPTATMFPVQSVRPLLLSGLIPLSQQKTMQVSDDNKHLVRGSLGLFCPILCKNGFKEIV